MQAITEQSYHLGVIDALKSRLKALTLVNSQQKYFNCNWFSHHVSVDQTVRFSAEASTLQAQQWEKKIAPWKAFVWWLLVESYWLNWNQLSNYLPTFLAKKLLRNHIKSDMRKTAFDSLTNCDSWFTDLVVTFGSTLPNSHVISTMPLHWHCSTTALQHYSSAAIEHKLLKFVIIHDLV